jgi:hypothetical protein
MLNITMLSGFKLIVVMLSVVAPVSTQGLCHKKNFSVVINYEAL